MRMSAWPGMRRTWAIGTGNPFNAGAIKALEGKDCSLEKKRIFWVDLLV
jgi:hypothetical protein